MRYPAKLVSETDAVGPDTKLKAQMNDEVPVIVPNECPPATGSACEPVFYRYQYMIFGPATGSPGETCESKWRYGLLSAGGPLVGQAGDTVNLDVTAGGGIITDCFVQVSMMLQPVIDRCGHRTRFVITDGTMDWTWALPMTDGDGISGTTQDAIDFLWFSGIASTPPRAGTVQMQIDLTDAAPGDETWTDIGPLVNVYKS
jgi:hypothetical protein